MESTSTDWERIYAFPALSRTDSECWERCSSYCCNPRRVTQNFCFFPRKGSELLILPGELEYLRRVQGMQQGCEESLRELRVPISSARTISVYRVTCTLEGRCSAREFRPLICRMYPLFPIVAPDGRVTGLAPFSLFDALFSMLKVDSPCVLCQVSLIEVDNFLSLCAELFKDPVNVFLVMAAHQYKTHMIDRLITHYPELSKEPESTFFSKWEKLFLTGKLTDQSALLRELASIADRIEVTFGAGSLGPLPEPRIDSTHSPGTCE